jgi:hypothetical protein
MAEIDRRNMLLGILRGATIVAVGAAVLPNAADAAPLDIEKGS